MKSFSLSNLRTLVILSLLFVAGSAAGCSPEAGYGGSGGLSKSSADRLQQQLYELEWQICRKWSATYGIATAPVIPGRVDVVPNGYTLKPRYEVKRGRSIYIPNATGRLTKLHKEIDQLGKQYRTIEKKLKSAGYEPKRLAKCSSCGGRRIKYGPHYRLGRKSDGSLGMVFSMGGLHRCRKCGGTGVHNPHSKKKKGSSGFRVRSYPTSS